MNFNYYQPTKLFFGKDVLLNLNTIIGNYGNKVLIIGPKPNTAINPMFRKLEKLLHENNFQYYKFYEVEPNPSIYTVESAITFIKNTNPSLIIAMGGGSVIDTAKLSSVLYDSKNLNWNDLFDKYNDFTKEYPKITNNKIPVVAIPSTSGTGSQCTHASVITNKEGIKLTIFHHQLFVEKAILDPNLTLTLPPKITKATAFDAFSHCLESYLRSDNPLCNLIALEGIKKIIINLPKVLVNNNVEYRANLMIADTFGGISLTNCGAMLPHPLSEIIGSFIKISHGDALAMVYMAFIKHTLKKYETKYANIIDYLDNNYKNLSNNEKSLIFYQKICSLIKECDLERNILDFENNPNKLSDIKKFIINLNLPMEDQITIDKILNDIFH